MRIFVIVCSAFGKDMVHCMSMRLLYFFNCECFCNLVFGGQQESVEATAEVSKTFNEKIRKYCDMTLLSCAYAGTGNVLKVLIKAL